MRADDILFAPIGVKQDITLPDSWLAALRAIQAQPGWGCSTLAGGALRDYELGRPVKDVDIFVPHLLDVEDKLYAALQGFHGPNLRAVSHSSHNTSQLGKPGIPHFHFEQNGWKFEVSQKTDAFDHKNLLESFDIGLCMISLHGSDIYRSEEYKKDSKNKTITVVRPTGGKELDHAFRIQQKYSGWTIIPL